MHSSSLAEFKDDKYSNLGNPGRPNFDQLAKSKPELILASFDKPILRQLTK